MRVFDCLSLASMLPDGIAVFPQGLERSDRSRRIDLLEKAAKPFGFRAAILRIDGIVNVAVEFLGKKLREGPIRKVQDVAAAHVEHVVEKEHFNGANSRHRLNPRTRPPSCAWEEEQTLQTPNRLLFGHQ